MCSTFFQASEVSASDSNEPECEPSRSARSIHSADECSPSIGPISLATPTLENSAGSAYGTTATQLAFKLSAAASPARMSRSPMSQAPAWTESGAGSGTNTPELLATYDHASSSWRTSQSCLIEGWTV